MRLLYEMQRDPKRRLRDIADAAFELDAAPESAPPAGCCPTSGCLTTPADGRRMVVVEGGSTATTSGRDLRVVFNWVEELKRKLPPALNRPPGPTGVYNPSVSWTPLALDTSAEVERLQIERWRRMSPAEKAAIVTGLTQAAFDLALAGIRQRHPRATAREHVLRLAVLVLGPELARRVYPESAVLDRPAP